MENHKIDISSKWLVICSGLVIMAFIAVTVFKVSIGNLFLVGIVLACPLMHIWMMKNGGHKH